MSARLTPERVYACLLGAYSREFRRACGAEAARTFAQVHADAATRGPAALALLWIRTLLCVLRDGPADRAECWRSARRQAAVRRLSEVSVGRITPMDVLRQDLVFAIRLLRRDRSYALALILTLAVAIGANVAIFTIVRSVLLRPFAYPEPDRLVFAYDSYPGAGVERAGTSVPNYFDRRQLPAVFDSVALYRFRGFDAGDKGRAQRTEGAEVTPSFFHVLRAKAASGRLFAESDGDVGHEHVAILSAGYWQRQFGGGPVIGHDIRLNGERYTIVGIVPESFAFLDPDVRVYVPLAFTAEERSAEARHSQNHDFIGRLAPGATLAQAQARLDALTKMYIAEAGPLKEALVNAGAHTVIVSLQEDYVRNVKTALQLLWGGVLCVLLIAAVNITNLAMARTSGRMRELATRHAIGAAQIRVARQLLTETGLLTLAGAALGLALAGWSLGALPWIGLADLPRAAEIRMDAVVVLFTVGLALALGLIVGVVPALQLNGLTLNSVLREEGRSGTAGRSSRTTRRTLVVAQVALAFVLLCGAGLLLASFQQLLAVDPGFTSERVLTGRLLLPEARYKDDAALGGFVDRALSTLRALPGVEAAAAASTLPFSGGVTNSVILAEGHVMAPGESVLSPVQLRAAPGYFELMRIPLRRGRLFTASDALGAPRVAIVDEALAKKFWPGLDPVGRRMYLPSEPSDVIKPGPKATWMQVVGVVGTVRMSGLSDRDETGLGAYYFPYAQDATRSVGIVVRTGSESGEVTAAVRRALSVLDPEIAFYDVLRMSERVERSLERRRTPMLLSVAFGAVALLLAAIGLYGTLAYQVAQRTREIGIRMALGSDATRVLRLVLREGLGLLGIGLAAGLMGAYGLRYVIASELYGITAFDPGVILVVICVLTLTSLVACVGPAIRAARVNPVEALSS